MKIVVQNFKTGKISVANTPRPSIPINGILVRTSTSLISAGTDRAVIDLAKKGYMGKAMARPDLVRRVIKKVKNNGIVSAFKAVQAVVAEPKTLGYSLVGEVISVGSGVIGTSIGDRVACAGAGFANHADVVAIPENLYVKVPDCVVDEDAAYVTLGAIAMHGIRQANQQFGAIIMIVGLGLVGQITLQICRAAGFKVIGLDTDESKLALARKHGAILASKPDSEDLPSKVAAITDGFGVDAVLLTVGSRNSGSPFSIIVPYCRDRARVVVVGDVKMDISRSDYFHKELEIIQSRSYGPGRYDPAYEEKGRDYPIGYVRWTERRNMGAFMDLLGDGSLDMQSLTTHRFPIDDAAKAYDLIGGINKEFTVGIVLTYGVAEEIDSDLPQLDLRKKIDGKVGLGFIGAGNFAKSVLAPSMIAAGGFDVLGVVSALGLSAEAMKKNVGAIFSSTDANSILENDDINAVVIATRHDSHGKLVLEALKCGKHVFVEKPLCVKRDELIEIEAVAKSSKGILMIGFNRRFSPFINEIAEHFKDRKEPLAMIYRVNAGRILKNDPLAWVHDVESGGGRIIGEACHFIDTMQFVTGASPIDLQVCGVNPNRLDLAANDIISLTISFDDGSMGTLHYFSNGDTSMAKERFEVFGQERIAVLDDYKRLDLIANGRTVRNSSRTVQKGYKEESEAFLRACKSGVAPIPISSIIETTLVTLLAEDDLHGSFSDINDVEN
ncbi:MAG: bi-domain-containing oxidoreductase [Pseudomonadota bacterium]|nr:bi-domain-containing oxidoreductase [Pseudomonadota bacterium]